MIEIEVNQENFYPIVLARNTYEELLNSISKYDCFEDYIEENRFAFDAYYFYILKSLDIKNDTDELFTVFLKLTQNHIDFEIVMSELAKVDWM